MEEENSVIMLLRNLKNTTEAIKKKRKKKMRQNIKSYLKFFRSVLGSRTFRLSNVSKNI